MFEFVWLISENHAAAVRVKYDNSLYFVWGYNILFVKRSMSLFENLSLLCGWLF